MKLPNLQHPFQHPFARSLVTVRTWPFFIDIGIACCGLAIFFAIIHTGQYWLGAPVPVIPISHSVRALPLLRDVLHRAHEHRLCAQPHLRHHLRLHRRLQLPQASRAG